MNANIGKVFNLSESNNNSDIPVKVEILETVCEGIRINDDNPSYTLSMPVTLDTGSLYFLSYQYFGVDGQADLSGSGSVCSRADGEFVRWFSTSENNSVTLTSTGITDTWRVSGNSSVITIYRIKIVVKDDLKFKALNYEGYFTVASGSYSHAEGGRTAAAGIYSHAEGSGTVASGAYSHAEGSGTVASGTNSHAEGGGYTDVAGCTAIGYCAHAEGVSTTARGKYAHAEGDRTVAEDWGHAEGFQSTTSGACAHAEGGRTAAAGIYSHAEGSGTVASGAYSHAEGDSTKASSSGAHAEGSGTVASGTNSHAEGDSTKASSSGAHAEGSGTVALCSSSHAEGAGTVAAHNRDYLKIVSYDNDTSTLTFDSTVKDFDLVFDSLVIGNALYVVDSVFGDALNVVITSINATEKKVVVDMSDIPNLSFRNFSCAFCNNSKNIGGVSSHAEGRNTIAIALQSHAEGYGTVASGDQSHAEGYGTVASGAYSHAEGSGTVASGTNSHASGCCTIAPNYSMTAIGTYNTEAETLDLFVVGKGSNDTSRANAFRVSYLGVYGTSAFNASGADYAEMFEWLDGNPDSEDRVGRFVTLEGEKIRLAGLGDEFILGVVSGNPSVVGGVYDDQWKGMYLTDVFGRPIMEDVYIPAETVERPSSESTGITVTEIICPTHTERRQKLNPDYKNDELYIPRSKRREWDAVGMLGKLVVVDDGTCQVNGWCMAGFGGTATASRERTRYRVICRLDESHVRILIL